MYVIERTDQSGGYVTRPGTDYSYTHRLELARTFYGKKDADNFKCSDNERVVSVEAILRPQ